MLASLRYTINQLISAAIGPFRLATLLTIFYWSVIFFGTHLPTVPVDLPRYNDKLMHGTAFAGLAFLLAWAIPSARPRRFAHLWIAALIAAIYGIFDEVSQAWIPGRHPDVMDYAADITGVVLGIIAYCVVRRVLFGPSLPPAQPLRLHGRRRKSRDSAAYPDCRSKDHDSINVA